MMMTSVVSPKWLVFCCAQFGLWRGARREHPPQWGCDRRATKPQAQLGARRFMRGINLSNYLEYTPGDPARTQAYSVNDFALIRAEGFDHVRVPVAWHLYAGPGPSFTLSNTIYSDVDFLVNAALNQGLSVLLDLHNFSAFTSDPAGNREKFYAIWRQVA